MSAKQVALATVLMALFITNAAASIKLKGSVFEREHHRIRYETAFQALGENSGFSADDDPRCGVYENYVSLRVIMVISTREYSKGDLRVFLRRSSSKLRELSPS